MRLRKLLLGAAAVVGIAGAAAFTPGKEAAAEGGWDCFKIEMNGPCGCKDKCFNNCTCPTPIDPSTGGDSEVAN
jgi:hypothetical protein